MKNTISNTAVIELGTTSVRMVIGQVSETGKVHIIDELEQAVSLGSDTLATGNIGPETVERCVAALASFRSILNEYAVADNNVRVIATSAVREAANSERFCDRILVATGFDIDVIDRPEVSRLTYQAIQPQLKKIPYFKTAQTMVIEVGGGSTEVMLFAKGKVSTSHLYRLGSLRLRNQIDREDILPKEQFGLVRADMAQMLTSLQTSLRQTNRCQLLLLGAEARFACSLLQNMKSDSSSIGKLKLSELKKLTGSIIEMSVDEIVRTHNLTYTEAETLGPSLLTACTLAEEFKLSTVYVSNVSLRTGVLIENVKGEQWTQDYRKQIIHSAEVCARTHHVDLKHAKNVAAFGLQIINAMRNRYNFTDREEVIYHAASLLHESGQHINTSSHHKHSFYIILNSDIFGIGGRDLVQTALIARYHRRAMPKSSHRAYMELRQTERISVSKLAAILRVANALDRLHHSRRPKFSVKVEEDSLIIETTHGSQLPLIRQRVIDRADLFREIFGMSVIIRTRQSA